MTKNLFYGLLLSAAVLLSGCSTSQKVHLASRITQTTINGWKPQTETDGEWTWDKPSPLQVRPSPHFKVGRPYLVKGRKYYPTESYNYRETGIASWYGPGFHGRLTANGEVFDMHKVSAAHKTLQLPCVVKVTNLENGRMLQVRVNDRGPYHQNRVIDLSRAAADKLGVLRKGTAKVKVEVLSKPSQHLTMLAKQGSFPEHVGDFIRHEKERHEVRLTKRPTVLAGANSQKYALEIRGIKSPEKALDYHDKLAKIGRVGIREHMTDNKRCFSVRLGPYSNKSDALKMVSRLQKQGHKPSVITIKS